MQTGNSNIEATLMTPLILKREEVTPMEVSTNAPAPSVFKVDVIQINIQYLCHSLSLVCEGAVS